MSATDAGERAAFCGEFFCNHLAGRDGSFWLLLCAVLIVEQAEDGMAQALAGLLEVHYRMLGPDPDDPDNLPLDTLEQRLDYARHLMSQDPASGKIERASA